MRYLKCIAIVFMAAASALPTAFAQSKQDGIVKEYRGVKEKTPVPGVEIVVANAGQNISGKNGKFSLTFRTLKPGDRIQVTRLEKAGYEIFNKEALDNWRIANDGSEFTIILCKSSKFKELKDHYYTVANKSFAEQRQKEEKAINARLESGEWREQEYIEAMKRLREFYDSQLENLDEYVDRIARIDMQTVTESQERKILEMVQDGKINEAIAAYEEMCLESRYSNINQQIAKEKEGVSKLQNSIRKHTSAKESVFSSLLRKYDIMLLAGGQENIQKVCENLKILAKENPDDVELLLYTGVFIANTFGREDEAVAFFETVYKNYDDSREKDENYFKAASSLEIAYARLCQYDKAIELCQKCISELKETDAPFRNHHLIKFYASLSGIYFDQNQYEKSMECLSNAEEWYEENEISDITDITSLLNTKAGLLMKKANLKEAEDCFKKSIKIMESEERIDRDYLTLLSNYALLLKNKGEKKEALETLDKALDLAKKNVGENSPTVENILVNRSTVLGEEGRMKESKADIIKAQEIADYLYPGDHDSKIYIQLNLANALLGESDFEQSLAAAGKALEMSERLFGEVHSMTADCYSLLANIYSEVDKQDESFYYAKKAVDINEKIYGKFSPNLITEYHNIGVLYSQQGDLQSAIEYYDKSLELAREYLGEKSKMAADIIKNKGNLYYRLKDYQECEKMFLSSLEIYKSLKEDEYDPIFISIYNDLTALYSEIGQNEKAKDFSQKQKTAILNNFGENSREMASYYNQLCFIYYDDHDIKGAIDAMDNCIRIYRNYYEPNSSKVTAALANRAYLLMASEQYDKAAEDLQAICEARASIYGNYSIQVIKAKQNLVTLYTKKGDKESLLRTYREIAGIYENLGMNDSEEYKSVLNNIEKITVEQ